MPPGSRKKPICPQCSRCFTKKSSLTRHIRRCFQNLPPASRRRACSQCSKNKVRCDQQHPICSRCWERSLPCTFSRTSRPTYSSPERSIRVDASAGDEAFGGEEPSLPIGEPVSRESVSPSERFPSVSTQKQASSLLLVPSEERRRVLLGAAPGTPNSSSAAMHTANFVIRVLKSWARLVATHHVYKLPPFIHKLQLSGDGSIPAPLANCFTLVKMWTEHTQGSMGLVESTVLLEIQRLLREYGSYNETDLLAALQSLLLLLTIVLFGLHQTGSAITKSIAAELIVKVWDVKSSVASTGILLDEEQSHVLPTWREWALVSAKRRTIQALHHLEWAWSLVHGYPVLTCFELGPLPAPTAGYLWNENDELQWKQSYTRWLDIWKTGGSYKLGELFNIDPGDDLNSRTEMWLAEVDEFGMVLMAELNAVDV